MLPVDCCAIPGRSIQPCLVSGGRVVRVERWLLCPSLIALPD